MDDQVLAIAFALASAFLFALASVLQQRSASEVSDDEAKGGRIVLQLVRRPLWLAGGLCDFLGYLAQAAALAVGSLLVVQPLIVTTLLFALPLGRAITGRHVYASDWAFAVLLTVSLAVFIEVGNPTDGVDRAPLSLWLIPLIVIAVLSAGAIAAASRRSGRTKALLLALTTGLLFGLSAALTKSVVDAFDNGIGDAIVPLLTSWETYVLAVAISIGFVTQQSAYQAGSLKESLPAMIVCEPIVAMGLGAIVLDEELSALSFVGWAIIVVALVAMLIATIQLSRSSAIHEAVPVG